MVLYTVYVQMPQTRRTLGRALFVPERFCWTAFLFLPLWLGIKRLWARLAFFLGGGCIIGLCLPVVIGRPIPPEIFLGLYVSLAWYAGLEGRYWWGFALRRRGYKVLRRVQADSQSAAEHIFYHYETLSSKSLVSLPTSCQKDDSLGGGKGGSPPLIGLFPLQKEGMP